MYTDFDNMDDQSRVWIYPAERSLSEAETDAATELCKTFVEQWTAHSQALNASCKILFGQFLVITVDEEQHGASGCSIDSSVRFIQELGQKIHVNFMNGGKVAIKLNSGIELLSTAEVKKLSAESIVDENTIVYNHLVKNMRELRNEFEVPAAHSWLSRFLLKKEEA